MKPSSQRSAGICCGCGAVFPEMEGPVHRYMTSSPACWSAYGVILSREYGDQAYAKFHRLSVDAYAVQHPGAGSPQAIKSVAVHLCRLCMILENGFSVERANDAMLSIHRVERQFRRLEPPKQRGEITVKDVLAAGDAEQHSRLVQRWAASCWNAWLVHHPTIRSWLPTSVRTKKG